MPRSIRGRMIALSAGATLLALLAAGLVIGAILGRIVTQGIDRRLDAEIALLATGVGKDGQIDLPRIAMMRGALDAGPGWQWQIVAPDRTIGSRDFPEPDHGPPERRRDHASFDRPSPYEGRETNGSAAHARQLTLETANGRVLLRASAPRAVIEAPIREAAIPLLGLLAILSLVLAAASLLQIRYGLRPLRTLRASVADIRSGRAQTIPDGQPDELRPLAEELNALARDNREALSSARASAANLAHALKTPVATLALELRADPEGSRQVARIEATIRHHLARAREGLVDRRARTSVAPAIEDLVAAISTLNAGRPIAFASSIEAGLEAVGDPADFDEMVGNLIDNAARHARAQVVVRAKRANRFVQITVEDDGPGISPEARARALQPGVRLDERGAGHGFGLAIARELAELYQGRLELGESSSGGLAASLWLPQA